MDGQLLEITTVPIKIDITVNRAKLSPVTPESQAANILKAKPVITPSENRALTEQASRRQDVFVQSNDSGIKISYQATAKISMDSSSLNGQSISSEELAEKQSTRSIDRIMSEVSQSSKAAPAMSWSNGTLNLSYSSEQLGIDFEAADTLGYEFTPGSIDFKIEQMPQVNIEYTGGPIYVPRSADPNYVKPDLDILA